LKPSFAQLNLRDHTEVRRLLEDLAADVRPESVPEKGIQEEAPAE
jgi:hypothetical protein